ncbi:sodium/glutamate symporter [Pseudoxanthomonas sp. 3HH-4]|uniref:sodium/glutamate symporter n=1 Tax=Pseudoxanthomonas sp. 3HH-4 TaxID=1690214 RepID=UPI00163AF899|nr:sodium/glutamate symporter [Pseudoxanthomonas sp. 3HH-4]
MISDLGTFALGLLALLLAGAAMRRIPVLARMNIPVPVIAGVTVAIFVGLLQRFAGVSVQFSAQLTDFFLLVFFTTVGLSAKFSALRAGGKPLLILCVVTVLLLVVQNAVGIAIATAFDAHPFYGVLVGSVSFVGGPGTAAAWAKEAQAAGLQHAPEIAVGAATLAVVVGAIVSGPVTDWLIRRKNLRGPTGDSPASWVAPGKNSVSAPTIPMVMLVLLLIVTSVLAGALVNQWARAMGLMLPGFLTAMLAGAAITNIGDAIGAKLDLVAVERGGEIALQAFLVMYLMSLKLWALTAAFTPLVVNVALQVVITVMVGIVILFRWLGKDYDAAVTMGGFLGFGLSSMPVAMATMDSVASRHGPSPKAFLLIALAGSFFVDLANAFVIKAFLSLPWLR